MDIEKKNNIFSLKLTLDGTSSVMVMVWRDSDTNYISNYAMFANLTKKLV